MALITPPHLLDGPRWAGLRVGLLGGSFNPPHEGHVHISRIALQRLGLDFVWWLLTPHNPLKDKTALKPRAERMELCRRIARDPGIVVSDIEYQAGVNRTIDTLAVLQSRFPRTAFTLLAGMDNALIFHKWHRWQAILEAVPVVFIARPPAVSLVRDCPVRRAAGGRVSWLPDVPALAISSTDLRKN